MMPEIENPKSKIQNPKSAQSLLRRILLYLKFLQVWLRFFFILAVTAVVVGYWDHIQNYYERWQRTHGTQQAPGSAAVSADQEFEYYCGMHPFVVSDRPGKCPICGMDLSQRKKGEAVTLPEGTLARVQVSPQRIMQGGIQVEPVLYRMLTRTVRSYGAAEPAEGLLAKIVARFPGRVEELMVDAVGLNVKKGEPLARIYSPRYLAASQEYLRALSSQDKNPALSEPGGAELEKTRAEQLVVAARKRLALAGFTEGQLDAIAESGKISDSVTLYSPLSGTVIEKNILLGEAVEEGTPVFTVADLSSLWIQARVFEADIAAIKMGMPVEITTVAWPGVIFYGNVDFIYPTLDTVTRTVKVRVTVANPDGKLKPGMFANAVIRSPIGEFAKDDAPGDAPKTGAAPTSPPVTLPTQTQEDADKYIASLPAGAAYFECPMHANVVSDKPDDRCPLCGMTLDEKQTENAATDAGPDAGSTAQWTDGYACPMHPDELGSAPGVCTTCNCGMAMQHYRVQRVLSIPESAVIDTGERKVVYIETAPGVYDARAVTLGTRTGKYYPVIDGLALGQRVVSQGSFLIDAEARLNPDTAKGAAAEPAKAPADAHEGMAHAK